MDNLFDTPFIIAADHGGFALKQHLLRFFDKKQLTDFTDLGQFNAESSNFATFSKLAADALKAEKAKWGIVVCGSGMGISMAANRFSWIRCALCHDVTSAKLARLHHNANLLALGGRLTGTSQAEDIIEAFTSTPFLGGKYEDRWIMVNDFC